MPDLKEQIEILRNAAKNPRKQMERYLSEGKKVVGCFAVYTPEVLVHASGMIPMGIWGGQTELKEAKRYLPAFACSIMQTSLEMGIRGTYKGLSAVMIPALCDTFRCITQDWRFGVTDIPMIPITYPQNRVNKGAADFLISEFETVLTKLSTITGQMMTEAALEHSIEIYNEHNAVMRKFTETAKKHLDVITPSVRHDIMKSAFFYEKSEHTELMNQLIEALEREPEFEFKGKKMILTGIMAEPEELLDILSENHIAVVSDDLAQESRQYRTDIPVSGGSGLRRLALQWLNHYGCALAHEEKLTRPQMLVDMCREDKADGVIACMMKFCDPEEYDYPTYSAKLKENGYRTLFLEIDLLNSSYEQARTRIQTFTDIDNGER